MWTALAGHPTPPIGFDNATYLSELRTADRNFALAHLLVREVLALVKVALARTLTTTTTTNNDDNNCRKTKSASRVASVPNRTSIGSCNSTCRTAPFRSTHVTWRPSLRPSPTVAYSP